jgi:hypothetical protein
MVVSNFEPMKYLPRLRSSVAMAVASAFGVGVAASGLDMMGRPVGLPTAASLSNGPNVTKGSGYYLVV